MHVLSTRSSHSQRSPRASRKDIQPWLLPQVRGEALRQGCTRRDNRSRSNKGGRTPIRMHSSGRMAAVVSFPSSPRARATLPIGMDRIGQISQETIPPIHVFKKRHRVSLPGLHAALAGAGAVAAGHSELDTYPHRRTVVPYRFGKISLEQASRDESSLCSSTTHQWTLRASRLHSELVPPHAAATSIMRWGV
jgi:hypothetical protein